MPPAIRKLENENITIYTAPTRSLLESLDATNQVLLDILNEQTEPVIHIADMSAADVDFEDILKISANAAYGEDALFRHPMIAEVLVVTEDPAMALAAQGMTTDAYFSHGKDFILKVFSTLDEALAYARSE